ncbi:MAG: hypothetical protein QOC99_2291 [Acidobacteriota bacterium]|jgi:DUF4097 and DUF4098 domain-containing protein YvlB|nr:hypothetical protein [Acidobacteriota bacterium]
MKGRIFVVILLVAAAAFAGRWVSRTGSPQVSSREETRQTFKLEAGARVEVEGINGPVEINTAETDTAEVHILRTASSADALEYSKITVEATASGLVVRGENSGGHSLWRWLWGGGGHVKQEVTLTLPRRVELSTKGVNGSVTVGEVDGSVEVEGINGRVEVAQSFGHSEIKGINGNVKFGVSQLGAQGMEIKGINGNVEIRLKENINADIEVKGQNGNFSLNVPNVTMQERKNYSNVRARLGTGGTLIEVKGCNGNLRFESDAPASTTATTNAGGTVTVTNSTPGTSATVTLAAPPAPSAPLPR